MERMSDNNSENYSEQDLQTLKDRAFTSELKGLIEKVIVPRSDDDIGYILKDYHKLFYRVINDFQYDDPVTVPVADIKAELDPLSRLMITLGIKDYALYEYDFRMKTFEAVHKTGDSQFPVIITYSFFSESGCDPFREYLIDDMVYMTGNAALYRMTRNTFDQYPPLPLLVFSTEKIGRERENLADSVGFSVEFQKHIDKAASSCRKGKTTLPSDILDSFHVSAMYHSSGSSSWFFLKCSGVKYHDLSSIKIQLKEILSSASHSYLFTDKGLVLFVNSNDISALNSFYLDLRVKTGRRFVLTEITTRNEQQLLNMVISSTTG